MGHGVLMSAAELTIVHRNSGEESYCLSRHSKGLKSKTYIRNFLKQTNQNKFFILYEEHRAICEYTFKNTQIQDKSYIYKLHSRSPEISKSVECQSRVRLC